MALKKWSELPTSVKMSRRKLYNYIVSELTESGDTSASGSNDSSNDDESGGS